MLPLAAHEGVCRFARRNASAILVLAVVQMGGPLLLIAVGEQEISSSLTGILVATAPIFTVPLAFTLEGEERASGLSLVGVAIGIGGVALLLGIDAGGGMVAPWVGYSWCWRASATGSGRGSSSGACAGSNPSRWSVRPPPRRLC